MQYKFNPNLRVEAETLSKDMPDDFKTRIAQSGVLLEERRNWLYSQNKMSDPMLVVTDMQHNFLGTEGNKDAVVLSSGSAALLLDRFKVLNRETFENVFVKADEEPAPPAVEPDTEPFITDEEYRDYSIRACIFMEHGVKDGTTPVKAENVAGDKGGLTKYGISEAAFPNVDIKNLTYDGAVKIYAEQMWPDSKASLVPRPLSAMLFDLRVTSGPKNAIRVLQRAVGTTDDGLWGPKTQEAAKNACSTMQKLLAATRLFTEKRIAYYQAIVTNNPSQSKFLNGWINRAVRSQNFAQALMYTLNIL